MEGVVLPFINTLTFERRCIRPGFVAHPRRIPDTPSVGRLAGERFALVPRWSRFVGSLHGMRRIGALGVDRIDEREHSG
jgi:hypothetical protein